MKILIFDLERADNRQWRALDGERVVALSADPLHFISAMIGSTGYLGGRDVVAASIGGQVNDGASINWTRRQALPL